MEVVWPLVLVGAMILTLPASPRVKLVLYFCIAVAVLGVFQTTGGRGSYSFTATYVVVGFLATCALLRLRRETVPWLFLPLLGYVFIGIFAIWDGGTGQAGGTINLLLAVGAWAAGMYVGVLYREVRSAQRVLVVFLVIVLAFETVVCALQLAGFEIFAPGERTAELEGGRANGTFTHPSAIGKALTIILILLLPATRSADQVTRRWAFIGVILSVLPIVMTVSRSNLAAVGAMIVVWSLIQPREKFFARRFVLPAIVAVVLLFSLDALLERFQEDPVGGQREHFMEVALFQFDRTPWAGVGPGSYIRVVGGFDPLTAEGWPVHNIFVLQAVEIGLIGAVLFFLPAAFLFVRAVGKMRKIGPAGDYARAVVAYSPAFVIIGVTGWGLLAPGMIALLYFVLGFAQMQLKGSLPNDQAPDSAVTDPARVARAR